ncbi:MAG: hypothetical protein CVU63_18565, partial [Deltaproteobacteria bacterium HGW-Deltaproteobacteria-20]
EEALTTGTVTIANGGRVTMVTSRSMNAGYPWMDTLAHELTHVAVGMGGPRPFGCGRASPCTSRSARSGRMPTTAGLEMGLARKFDEIGPPVALLPPAAHAIVRRKTFVHRHHGRAGS